jgi:transposase InsO family protein
MRFSFIDAREPNSRSRAFAKLLKSARVVISLGKLASQANASAKTWCFLPISASASACRSPRMHANLMDDGIIAARHRIARLMRDNELKARGRRLA